ncbi:hypothetical protein KP509_12G033700 [Ceratopteris richardii]|uniref:Uncharacterized protein n=1 Tax=Ceratopteris richardii TaxID=49495 RepID=A0A8T2THY5_CERRI|nr:hypothetical protein KP509_12G033700 [Ceratopteris richardii]
MNCSYGVTAYSCKWWVIEMALAGCWQTFTYLKSTASISVQTVRIVGGSVRLCTRATADEWEGLQAWRSSSVDERRFWGPKNTCIQPSTFTTSPPLNGSNCPSTLAEWGALVLSTSDPHLKASITHHAFRLWSNHQLSLGTANAPDRPARPEKPILVPLKQVPDVRSSPLPRNAHALHILAHIELNAVDLAWDTVRLSELGCQYGDMPAHDVLVGEGQKSAKNVMARLAVVPMVQEARGLDSGPRLAGRLVGWGDVRSASIVSRIAEEELAHVAVGVSWFLEVCKMIDRRPDTTFRELIQDLNVELKGPFNHAARQQAGLPRTWYEADLGSNKVEKLASDSEIEFGHTRMANGEVYKRLELLIAMEKERAS